MTETTQTTSERVEPEKGKNVSVRVLGILIFVPMIGTVALIAFFFVLNQPPKNFPLAEKIVIEKGSTARTISRQFYQAGAVQSDWLLYLALTLKHDPTKIQASAYVFDEPLTLLAVAARLTNGDFGHEEFISITHFEGESVAKLAARLDPVLVNFNAADFQEQAIPLEGQLYPDTYHIPPEYSTEQVIELLHDRHLEIMDDFSTELQASSLSADEVVILASILEREANSPESLQMVAGILQNRLAINMPLQADATIEYVLDRPIAELRPGELAEIIEISDSPYNSYKHIGLPPTPIGNPGRDAIEAVLTPIASEYLFYITGNDGIFYYGETYDQHLSNIQQHLR